MSAISSPESFTAEQPVAFPGGRRPGASLDYFFMRRRSATIGEQFWTFVLREWPRFDPIERTRSARLFARYRSFWTLAALPEDDRAFYESLPENFLVFRGQNGAELAAGGSFTLSEQLARSHATGRRKMSYADPTVLSLRVTKSDVAFAYLGGEAHEIVLFPTLPSGQRPARLTH